jgi:hypothetical protein
MNIDTKIIDGSAAVIRPEGRLTMVSTAGLRSLRSVVPDPELDALARLAGT